MLVCKQCNSKNPRWATHCQSCQAELQPSVPCHNCGTVILKRANFCGNCGINLRQGSIHDQPAPLNVTPPQRSANPSVTTPPKVAPLSQNSGSVQSSQVPPSPTVPPPLPVLEVPPPNPAPPDLTPPSPQVPVPQTESLPPSAFATSIQDLDLERVNFSYQLLHLRTSQSFPLPRKFESLYLGKPNDRYPPHLDLSALPDADVVSRVHGRIFQEDSQYYLEDLGSSNGTYLNDEFLSPYEPVRLELEDKICLGKNNLMSFLFTLDNS